MRVKKLFKIINVAELILGILSITYYLVCILIAGRGVSILYIWIVAGILFILKGISGLCINRKKLKWARRISGILDISAVMICLSVAVFIIFIIHGMNEEAKTGCDYIIVLGASVNGTEPSEILQKRIDAAYEYLRENPDTMVIGTGGRGATEQISEGKCIADTLEKMGISSERILYEEKSVTTVENISFAMRVIPDSPGSIAVVSNGFHIARSKLILSNFTEAQVYGIPATGGGFLTLHYILREYVVFVIDVVLGNYKII